MLPHVILHVGVSLDGRIDWGRAPGNPYYDLVPAFKADIDLSTSNTMLAAIFPDDPFATYGEVYQSWMDKPDAERPVLAVVDSRGRVKSWQQIRVQPWWRGHVALCSQITPPGHLEYLREQGVEIILAGEDHVDLREALAQLYERYGVRTVRADCGGILNGLLLRQGLVDEVSVILAPELVGGTSPRTMFVAQDLGSADGVIPLKLMHVEEFTGGFVWLRYQVNKGEIHDRIP